MLAIVYICFLVEFVDEDVADGHGFPRTKWLPVSYVIWQTVRCQNDFQRRSRRNAPHTQGLSPGIARVFFHAPTQRISILGANFARISKFFDPLLTQQYIQDREFQWNDVISSDAFTIESLERNSCGKLDLEIMVQIQNNESYWLLCFTVICST